MSAIYIPRGAIVCSCPACGEVLTSTEIEAARSAEEQRQLAHAQTQLAYARTQPADRFAELVVSPEQAAFDAEVDAALHRLESEPDATPANVTGPLPRHKDPLRRRPRLRPGTGRLDQVLVTPHPQAAPRPRPQPHSGERSLFSRRPRQPECRRRPRDPADGARVSAPPVRRPGTRWQCFDCYARWQGWHERCPRCDGAVIAPLTED